MSQYLYFVSFQIKIRIKYFQKKIFPNQINYKNKNFVITHTVINLKLLCKYYKMQNFEKNISFVSLKKIKFL